MHAHGSCAYHSLTTPRNASRRDQVRHLHSIPERPPHRARVPHTHPIPTPNQAVRHTVEPRQLHVLRVQVLPEDHDKGPLGPQRGGAGEEKLAQEHEEGDRVDVRERAHDQALILCVERLLEAGVKAREGVRACIVLLEGENEVQALP
eukprot:CAMPEP_0206236506 /NCGR_PEP_ID=MMETSP0047_2-20121206/13755_1 /ASSEMBLY_ACC=CAM_ASM_000192 /TAXON_ID=195065 /ORGANISM="Chroomonas mesostigmatica_cf, Strain CCMP1168" /LENGTH=147 /DNA_ID=CAMNT_0053660853 /DNA_START=211 /DNA_END=654 /DNA_ORIENTATION=+